MRKAQFGVGISQGVEWIWVSFYSFWVWVKKRQGLEKGLVVNFCSIRWCSIVDHLSWKTEPLWPFLVMVSYQSHFLHWTITHSMSPAKWSVSIKSSKRLPHNLVSDQEANEPGQLPYPRPGFKILKIVVATFFFETSRMYEFVQHMMFKKIERSFLPKFSKPSTNIVCI